MNQRLTPDSRVTVHPFTRVAEDDEVVIGRPETQSFLAVPQIGVEVLDRLAAGSTIGDTETWLVDEYGEAADIADFLVSLEKGGFVSFDGGAAAPTAPAAPGAPAAAPAGRRYHFQGIPTAWAGRIFCAPALWTYLAVIFAALAATTVHPGIMPGRSSLVFRSEMTLSGLALVALLLLTVFLHEMAHLVAARALGVPARLGVSHRLWFLVVETDMTGLWGLPREQRNLPILAGPLADATMASGILLVLSARQAMGWHWPAEVLQLAQALVFLLILRLVWQLFFFMRTDFYYLVANVSRCKNLMQDTRTYFRHLWARFRGRAPGSGWDGVPDREQRVVRRYALFWLGGRGVAVAMFALVHLPVLVQYVARSFQVVKAGPGGAPLAFADGLVVFCISISTAAAGSVLWLRSILKREKV